MYDTLTTIDYYHSRIYSFNYELSLINIKLKQPLNYIEEAGLRMTMWENFSKLSGTLKRLSTALSNHET